MKNHLEGKSRLFKKLYWIKVWEAIACCVTVVDRYVSSQGWLVHILFLHLNNSSFITVCIDVVREISRLYANAWCIYIYCKLECAVALGIRSQYACVQSHLIQVAIFCCEQTSLIATTLRHECSCGGTSALLSVCKSFKVYSSHLKLYA